MYFYNRSKNGLASYFLGERQINPWVTALSAQASDMSAWLFMSLPGAACLFGYQAAWIAIGLFIGTYLNWRIVARRLRNFTASFGDSITVPEYLQNRFHTKSPYIRLICSAVILIFFLLYVASGFSAEAKLFEELFGMSYRPALFLGAFIILFYTFLGGFQAVCWTDFFQSILMFFALLIVPIIVLGKLPASESVELVSGEYVWGTLFSSQTDNGIGDIISGLGWGLGYFGMPHILVRFMAIRSADEIKRSRVIAVSWVFLTLVAAIAIGVFGGAYLASQGVVYETQAMAERIFMRLSTMLFSSWIAGILLSAILAAIMSTVSSQLLVVGSAMVNDIYCLFSKKQTDKRSMLLSRISIVLVTGLGIELAWFPDSSVMGFVSYAWAGFGATFAPVILLSLIWKRLTLKGAMAGMILGAVGVIAWESLDMYSITGFGAIVPCFIFSILSIVVVTLLDKEPDKKLLDQFEKASNM
ncbi:MAG: sodium/proline symporter PutP [Bacteroides sp.]|nr:sodium/proline symporter PutP [Bacteroides sp.]